MVEHICVKFGDPSCIGFWDIVWKADRQTNTQTPLKTLYARDPTTVGVGKKLKIKSLN